MLLEPRAGERAGRDHREGLRLGAVHGGPHQDAADLVVRLEEERKLCAIMGDTTAHSFLGEISNLIEQQAKALSEAEERCAKLVRDVICTIDWPPTDGDTLIDALQSAIRTGKVS